MTQQITYICDNCDKTIPEGDEVYRVYLTISRLRGQEEHIIRNSDHPEYCYSCARKLPHILKVKIPEVEH